MSRRVAMTTTEGGKKLPTRDALNSPDALHPRVTAFNKWKVARSFRPGGLTVHVGTYPHYTIIALVELGSVWRYLLGVQYKYVSAM